MIAKVLGYQGIPATRTVRECRPVWPVNMPWVPACGDEAYCTMAGDPHERHERTVVDPILVVPNTVPCPECGGDGSVDDPIGNAPRYTFEKDCQRCGGSGRVLPPKPDYIATDQCRLRTVDGYVRPWVVLPDCALHDRDDIHERRQVVAYKVTATEPLPVVDDMRGKSFPGHPLIECIGRHRFLWDGPDSGDCTDVTDEPWAADLTPGCLVWRLHLEALEQPYTAAIAVADRSAGRWCETCSTHGSHHTDRHEEFAVPLSVPVGEVTEIELVEAS